MLYSSQRLEKQKKEPNLPFQPSSTEPLLGMAMDIPELMKRIALPDCVKVVG